MAIMKPRDLGRPKPKKPPERRPRKPKATPTPRKNPFAGLDELIAHDRNRRKTMSGR